MRQTILSYAFPPLLKEQLEELAVHGPDPYREPDSTCVYARRQQRLFERELVEQVLALHIDPNTPPALHITNAPLGDVSCPPAFDDAGRPIKAEHASEYFLLALATLGCFPAAILAEHHGYLVHNIVPTLAGARSASSASSERALAMHRENLDLPVDALVIGAGYAGVEAETFVAESAQAWAQLDDEQRVALRDMKVQVRPPLSRSGESTWSSTRAFVEGDDAAPHLVYAGYGNTMRIVGNPTLAKLQALAALERHLEAVATSIVLHPGSVLVLSNLRALHARGPFRYTGERQSVRHLQRVQCTYRPPLGAAAFRVY